MGFSSYMLLNRTPASLFVTPQSRCANFQFRLHSTDTHSVRKVKRSFFLKPSKRHPFRKRFSHRKTPCSGTSRVARSRYHLPHSTTLRSSISLRHFSRKRALSLSKDSQLEQTRLERLQSRVATQSILR
jgi:hypothetical protein